MRKAMVVKLNPGFGIAISGKGPRISQMVGIGGSTAVHMEGKGRENQFNMDKQDGPDSRGNGA